MLTIYIGETFQLAAALQKDAEPADFTNWLVQADLSEALGSTFIETLVVSWIDTAAGLFTLTAPSTETWPAGKARIDFRVVAPSGEIVMGPPAYLRIAQSTVR